MKLLKEKTGLKNTRSRVPAKENSLPLLKSKSNYGKSARSGAPDKERNHFNLYQKNQKVFRMQEMLSFPERQNAQRTKTKLKPLSSNLAFNSTKGQIKIQEMAFVLLAIVLLAIIATVFFIKFQSSRLTEAADYARQQTAISLLDKVASMTELSCKEEEICLDEDKLMIVKNNQTEMANLFQGIKEIKIKKIHPSTDEIIFYKSGQKNESYSTFVNVCKQRKSGYSFEWSCEMAMLIIGY